MSKKATFGVLAGVLLISGFIGFFFIPGLFKPETINPGVILLVPSPTAASEKWALIIASSHTFHESDITPGVTPNPDLDVSPSPPDWYEVTVAGNPTFNYDTLNGKNDTDIDPGCLYIMTDMIGDKGQWENWIDNDICWPEFGYCLSIWVQNNSASPTSKVYVGFNWTSNVSDPNPSSWTWDGYEINTGGIWQNTRILSQCPSYANQTGAGCKLVFGCETGTVPGMNEVFFDTLRVNLTINVTNPGSSANQTQTDGFPAQAIQSYWALRNNSWKDENIFLMINAGDTDVRVWNPFLNDYTYTAPYIDVVGNDVNRSRFIRELNASIPGSFASKIKSKDEVLIYMIDHGGNIFDPTPIDKGNATFHFDTGGFVTERLTNDLLNTINCKLLILMADMCFAGNFIQPFLSSSPNRILIGSSAPNRLSWYWVMATNFHFAGSFFFHDFWLSLRTQGNTLMNAFTAGQNHVPWNNPAPVQAIQGPLGPGVSYIDNVGTFNSWKL